MHQCRLVNAYRKYRPRSRVLRYPGTGANVISTPIFSGTMNNFVRIHGSTTEIILQTMVGARPIPYEVLQDEIDIVSMAFRTNRLLVVYNADALRNHLLLHGHSTAPPHNGVYYAFIIKNPRDYFDDGWTMYKMLRGADLYVPAESLPACKILREYKLLGGVVTTVNLATPPDL